MKTRLSLSDRYQESARYRVTKKVQKWIDALRSGEYNQGGGLLYRPETENKKAEFCCLGVWEHCTGTALSDMTGRVSPSMPTELQSFPHHIDWFGNDDDLPQNIHILEDGSDRVYSLTDLNDIVGMTFNEIADLFQNSEFYIETERLYPKQETE